MLKGCTEPRLYTKPLRELTPETSLGYAFIEFCREVCHLPLFPWQEWLAIHILEIVGDLSGEWVLRYRTVVVEVARQNGKTHFEKLLGLFFNYVLGSKLVIGTAQNLDNSTETFESAVEIIEDNDELLDNFGKVSRGMGRREYFLASGERWKVISASRKARGWSADLVMLDELREQTNWDAWSAVSKTLMARPSAMCLCLSNAGDGSSVVLKHFRIQAHKIMGDPDGLIKSMKDLLPDDEEAGIEDDSLGWFEWSAPPNASKWEDLSLQQANPSLGYGLLTERALKSARATDPDHVFKTECLCQWVDTVVEPPFDIQAWNNGIDEESEISELEEVFYAVDVSHGKNRTAIAVCGLREDGFYHTEVIAYRAGIKWAFEFMAREANKGHNIKLALQARGAPISAYINNYNNIDHVELIEIGGRDLGASFGRFYDAVEACNPESDSDAIPVMHRPQPALDESARTAQLKSVGDGAFVIDRKNSPIDASPLMACVLAFGLATGGSTEKQIENVYASRGVFTI